MAKTEKTNSKGGTTARRSFKNSTKTSSSNQHRMMMDLTSSPTTRDNASQETILKKIDNKRDLCSTVEERVAQRNLRTAKKTISRTDNKSLLKRNKRRRKSQLSGAKKLISRIKS